MSTSLLPRSLLLAPPPAAATAERRDDDLARRVELAKIHIALRASPGILSTGVVAVLLIVFAMGYDAETGGAVIDARCALWALATIAGMANGVLLRMRFNRSGRSDAQAVQAVRLIVANAMFIALAWGSASWLLLPARTLAQDGLLLIAVAMVTIGGAVPQSVHRPLVSGFCIGLTAVFSAGLARFGDPLHLAFAGGFVLYGIAVLLYARNQEQAVATAVELALKNEELLAQRTQQRQAAEQARAEAEEARELAEQAHRSKSSFIAAVSHDLRQPMHALVQYVAHLKRVSADPNAAATVEKIESSVGAMADLLNAVLDFSKIAMGSVKPVLEPVSTERLLASIDTQIRPLTQAKGLALRIETRAGHVHCDAVLLERMLRNIVQNALRYTPAGTIVVRASAHGALTRLLVADSGIGIAAGEKRRIFDEHYQVDNHARDRRKGLGLGLAIVRDLAGLLRLRVRVRSLPGRGSTFAIDVPSAEAPRRVLPSLGAAKAADWVRGAFVVLIDDDPLALDSVSTTLRDFGCRVLAAASGIEALHALADAEFAPQMVISDYRLDNGVNGLEAIRMVVENQTALYGSGFALPALLICADTSARELEKVSAAGYPMLHKPVAIERLHAQLNAMLSRVMAQRR